MKKKFEFISLDSAYELNDHYDNIQVVKGTISRIQSLDNFIPIDEEKQAAFLSLVREGLQSMIKEFNQADKQSPFPAVEIDGEACREIFLMSRKMGHSQSVYTNQDLIVFTGNDIELLLDEMKHEFKNQTNIFYKIEPIYSYYQKLKDQGLIDRYALAYYSVPD